MQEKSGYTYLMIREETSEFMINLVLVKPYHPP